MDWMTSFGTWLTVIRACLLAVSGVQCLCANEHSNYRFYPKRCCNHRFYPKGCCNHRFRLRDAAISDFTPRDVAITDFILRDVAVTDFTLRDVADLLINPDNQRIASTENDPLT